MLKAIEKSDAAVMSVMADIAETKPDILLLTDFDYDRSGLALRAMAAGLKARGVEYAHLAVLPGNAGIPSGRDLDGDGRSTGWEDSLGFGRFPGEGAMAVLSVFPIETAAMFDLNDLLWKDFPNASLPMKDGAIFPSQPASDVQVLSTRGHVAVPIILPDGGRVWLLAAHATPPVFDGPENRNGLRNGDEIRLWTALLDGDLPGWRNGRDFVILGDLNADPFDGDGAHEAIRTLLNDPRTQDPKPESEGGTLASRRQGGVNRRHGGDPALDTADWSDNEEGPGNLRVDYVLPSSGLEIADAGVHWPASAAEGRSGAKGSRHHLVWVDIVR